MLYISDANPPVRLLCGHAISRDAMKKLVSHSRRYILYMCDYLMYIHCVCVCVCAVD